MDKYTKVDSDKKKKCREEIIKTANSFLDNCNSSRKVLLLDGKYQLESNKFIENDYNPINIYLPNNCKETHNYQYLNGPKNINLYNGNLSELLDKISDNSLSVVDYDSCGMPNDMSDIIKIIESKLEDKAVLGLTYCFRNNRRLPKNKLGKTTHTNRDIVRQKIIYTAENNNYNVTPIKDYEYKDKGSQKMFRQLYIFQKKEIFNIFQKDNKSIENIEYEVELLITFDAPRRRVLVKWEGYEEMTWEPHEQFKNTPVWTELMNTRGKYIYV